MSTLHLQFCRHLLQVIIKFYFIWNTALEKLITPELKMLLLHYMDGMFMFYNKKN